MIFDNVPATFDSRYTMAESVERLRAATTRSVFHSLLKQSASGTVTERKVSLQRVIPLVGNTFKPFFIGAFETVDGRVLLVGRFTTWWYAKVFMSVWFGFITLWTLMAAFVVIVRRDTQQWWFPLFGIGMATFGFAIYRFGKWHSRNDIAWLSAVIQQALSAEGRTNPRFDGRPIDVR